MKKVELLAPVGSREALDQAVMNGADAVYLSGKNFGARKFAQNFDNEELKEAVKFAHLYGVKVYVTVNTLIHDEEMPEVVEYVGYLHSINVDAVLVQDFGLMKILLKKYPNLEIHASTQAHNHNKEGLKLLKSMGVKRAVLARELSTSEIKELGHEIDLEVFVHGALCISYSGQCLFSSRILNRSGNRGECAGVCRLPYSLLENDKEIVSNKYLLSPKEVNMSSRLDEVLSLDNVDSLKIEGRMKSPEYVGFITNFYRKIIDGYYNNNPYIITEDDIKELRLLFNREFTLGHMFNDTRYDLMNIESPNHLGIPLGKVIEVNSKYIKIKLSEDLTQEDGIRFSNNEGMIVNFLYDKNEKLINKAYKNEIVMVDNKVGLKEEGLVLKTSSIELLKRLKNVPQKRIKVKANVKAVAGSNLVLILTDGINSVTKEGNVVEAAINQPMTEERIKEQIGKLGDTPFVLEEFELYMPSAIFIPVKVLNELRREVSQELIKLREGEITKPQEQIIDSYNNYHSEDKLLSVLVRSEEQLLVSSKYADVLYTDKWSLYLKYKDKFNIYFRTNRVNHIHNLEKEKLLIGEVGYLNSNNDMIGDYFLNVYNKYTALELLDKLKRVTLSVELSTDEIITLLKNNDINSEVIVYGTMEVMIMKYCPINLITSKDKKCSSCKTNNYYLKDRNNSLYFVKGDCNTTHIFDSKVIDLRDDIEVLKTAGVNSFRLELLNETEREVEEILQSIVEKLK